MRAKTAVELCSQAIVVPVNQFGSLWIPPRERIGFDIMLAGMGGEDDCFQGVGGFSLSVGKEGRALLGLRSYKYST